MKTISAPLLAHYAQQTTTLARLWKITRRDGQVFGFTDHDEPVTYSGVTYAVSSTFDPSAVQTSSDMNVDSVSAVGILAAQGVTAGDIEAGLWDGAAIQIVEVNYADLTMGENTLRVGDVGQIQRAGRQYTAELRGLMQYLQNNITRVTAASCDADLGDARCKVNLEALRVAGTVTSVGSPALREFTASALPQAMNYFRFGVVTWVTGANALRQMEIKTFAAGGVFELQLDMSEPIVAGDTFTVTPGCNKIGRGGLTTKSTTPVLIQTGTAVFNTSVAGLAYVAGERVVATSDSDPSLGTFVGGAVVSYSGTTLTVLVDTIGGTPGASFADWSITGGIEGAGDCASKFNNYINFRGFEDLPGQNKILLVGGQ